MRLVGVRFGDDKRRFTAYKLPAFVLAGGVSGRGSLILSHFVHFIPFEDPATPFVVDFIGLENHFLALGGSCPPPPLRRGYTPSSTHA